MHHDFPRRTKHRRVTLAVALVVAGAATLLFLAATQAFPTDDLLVWLLFAAAFIALEWRAVEVNDRLRASPTVMVALTAGVALGKEHAALGVATMAALALFTSDDIRDREWFRPAVNFGQFVITTAVAMTVLQWFLPSDGANLDNMWRLGVGSAIAAVTYGIVNLNLVGFIVRSVYPGRDLRPWSRLGQIFVPYLGMGFLGGLLGAAYILVGPVALPLIFIVFFVGHLTFASYAELREAQESTLRGFVKALEAKDLYTRGHTERVAYFSQLIGEELGFSGTKLERIRWAALIHDVGKLAVPRDLIRKKSRLTRSEYTQMQAHVHLVEDLLAEVEFLQPIMGFASNHHARFDGTGYAGSHHHHGDTPPMEACILAVADSFDAMTSTRSYRVALSQEYAFAELRAHKGTQFDPEVVEALIAVLERRGERYGSPDVADEALARRLAEEALAEHG